MAAFADAGNFIRRPSVTSAAPSYSEADGRPEVVIIANSAHDHFRSAADALAAGVPTFIEKPPAIGQAAVAKLRDLAEQGAVVLGTSNVVLFTRYLSAFANELAHLTPPTKISFIWTDGRADERHGEVKSYERSVTVFDDVLPHIVPILLRLRPGPFQLTSFKATRGGTKVAIEFTLDSVPGAVEIERDADTRRRLISVERDSGLTSLDFASEPGRIRNGGVERNGDPEWETKPRPLATMLSAFLRSAENGVVDERLHVHHALAAARVADDVRRVYAAGQIEWLGSKLGSEVDDDMGYALREMLEDRHLIEDGALAKKWREMRDLAAIRAMALNAKAFEAN